jgi:hypothetical protein
MEMRTSEREGQEEWNKKQRKPKEGKTMKVEQSDRL